MAGFHLKSAIFIPFKDNYVLNGLVNIMFKIECRRIHHALMG